MVPTSAPDDKPTAPAADGSLYATGNGSVVVDIKASDSGYDNKIYWSSDNWATKNFLGVDNHTASVNIGTFAAGTKIQFGIDNGQGDFFKAGPASASSDGFQHAQTRADASGLTIGFEDLRDGGDQDFNDAIVHVSGLSATPTAGANPAPAPTPVAAPESKANVAPPPKAAAPVAPPPKAAAPVAPPPKAATPVVSAPTKDNRSGLGDGTNPGKGAGQANSPNTGTQNPNQSSPLTLAQVAANAKLAAIKSVAQPTTAAKSGTTVTRKV
jgi:hypothetical protein